MSSTLLLAFVLSAAALEPSLAQAPLADERILSADQVRSFREDGYVVADDVIPVGRVDAMANAVERHVVRNRRMWVEGLVGSVDRGLKLPGFMNERSISPLHALKTEPRLLQVLDELAGGGAHPGYRFCGGDNLGVNRTLGWHRDMKLNTPFSFAYMRRPQWGPWDRNVAPALQGFDVLTVAVYLQDTVGKSSLMVKPGTHRNPSCSNSGRDCGLGKPVKVRKGSVVIFDKRLLHRGAHNAPPPGSPTRALATIMFGMRNNSHTDEVERAYAAVDDELVNVRAPTEAFILARAPAGTRDHEAWMAALDGYNKCFQFRERVSAEVERKAAELALAADPIAAADAYIRRYVDGCKAKYLLKTMGTELEAWLDPSLPHAAHKYK